MLLDWSVLTMIWILCGVLGIQWLWALQIIHVNGKQSVYGVSMR